jgi:hypothetical protein
MRFHNKTSFPIFPARPSHFPAPDGGGDGTRGGGDGTLGGTVGGNGRAIGDGFGTPPLPNTLRRGPKTRKAGPNSLRICLSADSFINFIFSILSTFYPLNLVLSS